MFAKGHVLVENSLKYRVCINSLVAVNAIEPRSQLSQLKFNFTRNFIPASIYILIFIDSHKIHCDAKHFTHPVLITYFKNFV